MPNKDSSPVLPELCPQGWGSCPLRLSGRQLTDATAQAVRAADTSLGCGFPDSVDKALSCSQLKSPGAVTTVEPRNNPILKVCVP